MLYGLQMNIVIDHPKGSRQKKTRIFYGQADRKGWPPPPYGQLFCDFFGGVHLTLVYDYDQLTNYLEKLGYFSNPPKKSCSNFFWVAQDLILVQLILIMQKITKKSLFGHFLGYPPKMHYSALQCSAMYWSANAWIIHSRWVK